MLDYTLESPKTRSLYHHLRQDIESGVFASGTRLPSKRQIAQDLHLSLSTVENALSLLEEEGYICARERKGYFVEALPTALRIRQEPFQFECLQPDEPKTDALFPSSLWYKTMRLVMHRDAKWLDGKSPAAGSARLRNVLASYLYTNRHMKVQPAQIIIGAGSEALYEILLKMFGKSFSIAIESPSYPQIEAVYQQQACLIEKIPMEEDGLCLKALNQSAAQFLHVTPFSSYPTFVTASAQKRHAYLDWIAERQGYLIEDDFKSEFFRSGPVLQTLYAMDKNNKVIYMNTFSRSLSPSLRLGYMVLPVHLLDLYEKTAGCFSNTVTMLEQYTLAEFIENGSFERLINRRRRQL